MDFALSKGSGGYLSQNGAILSYFFSQTWHWLCTRTWQREVCLEVNEVPGNSTCSQRLTQPLLSSPQQSLTALWAQQFSLLPPLEPCPLGLLLQSLLGCQQHTQHPWLQFVSQGGECSGAITSAFLGNVFQIYKIMHFKSTNMEDCVSSIFFSAYWC